MYYSGAPRMLVQPVLEDVCLQYLSVRDTHQNYWGTNLLWIDAIGGLVADLFPYFFAIAPFQALLYRGEARAPTVTIREKWEIL